VNIQYLGMRFQDIAGVYKKPYFTCQGGGHKRRRHTFWQED
jgi:hypothetical protein